MLRERTNGFKASLFEWTRTLLCVLQTHNGAGSACDGGYLCKIYKCFGMICGYSTLFT